MGVDPPELGPHCPIYLEEWHGSYIGQVLDEAAAVNPDMIVKKRPRRTDCPMTCFVVDGKVGLIDGRHRANLWAHKNSWHQVLVIYAE